MVTWRSTGRRCPRQMRATPLIASVLAKDCMGSLQDLYVDPACRGAGAGRALIRAVVDFARDRDANRVIWLTNEDNATARALYDTVARTTGLIQYRISPL
ncbi:MAG: GNAT family N-acetyltransferase [Chloroflexi bacterium]|nr:GNAT family N-acetyltransferase [Chloroflexota bacterium]